jgi:hypothetical protein
VQRHEVAVGQRVLDLAAVVRELALEVFDVRLQAFRAVDRAEVVLNVAVAAPPSPSVRRRRYW